MRLEHQPGDFPATGRLWPEKLHPVSADSVALGVDNLKKLVSLRVSARDGDPIRFHGTVDPELELGTNKPLVVLYGADTRVLVMPMRFNHADNGWQEWAALPTS